MLPWRVGMPTEDFTDVTLAGLVGEDTVEHDVPDGPDNSDGPDNPQPWWSSWPKMNIT